MEESQYVKIDKDRLVLYAVHVLEENRIEPTFEKVVAAAFKLFPKTFSLLGFPEYPDSRWIYYSLWHCVYQSKGWLSGSPTSGYHVTLKGKKIVSETLRAFSGRFFADRKVASKQERKEMHFLNLLEKSNAYQKYASGKANDITEMEIRIMLRARKDTPADIIGLNLKKYVEYAKVADRPKIVEFLDHIATAHKWESLFT
jgi:hypothetical protein